MNRKKKNRCLYCYRFLEDTSEFHPICAKKIFGKGELPEFPYTEKEMQGLANRIIRSSISVTGVQPKLSLDLEDAIVPQPARKRFTIVGMAGGFILKPPNTNFPHLPEVEDLTMHLAELGKIHTVPHSLIRLPGGTLAYITKRIDRNKKQKIHMEDMCQLTERLTEHKYDGSHEQIAKIILQHSANPLLDVVNFYELVLFSFLTGNSDMHLKNFSLIKKPSSGYSLAPAYDLVAVAVVYPKDKEELALALNGKKKKIKWNDFLTAAKRSNIEEKIMEGCLKKFKEAIPTWEKFIDISFLPTKMKTHYKNSITQRAKQLEK